MGCAVAADRVRARRRQDHHARLALLQPGAQRRRWRAISISGRFTNTTACTPTPLDRRRTRICFFLYSDLTEKNTETGPPGGGWISGRSTPTAAISTGTAGCKSGPAGAVPAHEQEHRARLLAALVALAGREESARPAPPANRCCGTCIGTKRRPTPKNARSCSAFSSINPVPKASVCVCFIFRWAGRKPRRTARRRPRRPRPASRAAPRRQMARARVID